MHTLVFVQGTFELWSFGLGANGQLGLGGTSNSLKPASVQGSYWTTPVSCEKAEVLVDGPLAEGTNVDPLRIFKGIFSGGDQSFITVQTIVIPSTDDPMVSRKLANLC